jgi:predicted NUDIX family phosphoesterase
MRKMYNVRVVHLDSAQMRLIQQLFGGNLIMAGNIEEEIAQLERRAKAVHDNLLHFAPRAFVIEFAGTPKAGKSTSVEAIRHFFARHDYRVHVLVERASVCPIPMKGHLFFNTWCASTMLAELLANVDTETDIIIVDRGIFDALVWLTMQRQRDEVTAQEAQTIEAFLLLDRWRSLIDLAVVMNVSAEMAIDRENGQRISRRLGSIMNPDVLGNISAAVKKAVKDYGSKFGGVIEYETKGKNIRESNAELASEILDQLELFLDPEILVVPRREVQKLRLTNGGAFSPEARSELLECISTFGKFEKRSQSEADSEQVQIIACGLLMRNEQVFLFERKERDPKYSLYGKSTIWQGSHVLRTPGRDGEDLLRSALLDRITRSLYLSRRFPLELLGCCWEPNNEKSSRHLGVMFKVDIDNDHSASDLRKKEFRRGRGHGLGGKFVNWRELTSPDVQQNLEAWSLAIVQGLKGIPGLKQAI